MRCGNADFTLLRLARISDRYYHTVISKLRLSWTSLITLRPNRRIAKEFVGLYVAQFVQVLLPIALIPFLARRLGPSEWGRIAYFQSFALCIAMVVEYGFGLSATRKLAQGDDSPILRRQILCEVGSAKVLLTVGCCLIALLLSQTLPLFVASPFHAISATVWGISQGANMIWYFQGVGKLSQAMALEVSGRVLAASLALFFVRTSDDGYLFLVLMAAGSLFATSCEIRLSYRTAEFEHFSYQRAIAGLKEGLTLFFFRSAVSLYTLGNSFILGTMAPPETVGYYAGAERISKGILTFIGPISQTAFAEINRTIRLDLREAIKLARRCMLLMTSIGLLLSLVVFFAAPLFVALLLGPNFGPAVTTTRMMSLLPFLVCVATSLGSNWMLPLHLDRAFNAIIVSAGILNVVLAVVLAPRLGQFGMGVAVVSSESFVCVAILTYLFAVEKDFFSIGLKSFMASNTSLSHVANRWPRSLAVKRLGGSSE